MAVTETAGHNWLAEIRKIIGNETAPRPAPDTVNAAMIRHWCEAIGDRNPVYTDADCAGRSIHRGIVAPPAMLDAWILQPEPPATIAATMKGLDAAGFTSVVATNTEHEYDRYLRPGDRLSSVVSITDISEEKQTGLGRGHFFTNLTEISDQEDKPVGRVRMRILKFKVGTARSAAATTEHSGPPPHRPRPGVSAGIDPELTQSGMPVDPVIRPFVPELTLPVFRPRIPARHDSTLTFEEVEVGDKLPPFPVPITTTLIIAGAIASRDFTTVHHDVEAARAQGAPNIFMNILTTDGLCGRYVTDWAGPEARMKGLSIRLGAPNYPGDTMTLSGAVTAKHPNGNGGLVEVSLRGMNRLGPHVTGKVTLDLPGKSRSR